MRPNHLWPPFDNGAYPPRGAACGCGQESFLAAAGFAPGARRGGGWGVFPPDTPLATSAGLDVWDGRARLCRAPRRDPRRRLCTGEPVVVMGTTDPPILRALAECGRGTCCAAAASTSIYQVMDWNADDPAARARRVHPSPGRLERPSSPTGPGSTCSIPPGHMSLRGTGEKAWFGWPTAPRLEEIARPMDA